MKDRIIVHTYIICSCQSNVSQESAHLHGSSSRLVQGWKLPDAVVHYTTVCSYDIIMFFNLMTLNYTLWYIYKESLQPNFEVIVNVNRLLVLLFEHAITHIHLPS